VTNKKRKTDRQETQKKWDKKLFEEDLNRLLCVSKGHGHFSGGARASVAPAICMILILKRPQWRWRQ
ncbi:hypothetical protein, partial [uncultured Bacteroides sp.]|uniref:hypothetical protein n=1 Tax=uncultured Bacteroides sp. TaxID=162156 RepID=UPI002613E019